MRRYESWGRYPDREQKATVLEWVDDPLPEGPLLAFGNGRSQGDVCLNTGGTLVDMRRCKRLVQFDPSNGVLTAEAGITLADILQVTIPAGWMLPVVPGTRFVTLGGAIANDVHGKNHHSAGSFGHHVTELVLRRSDGSVRVCKPGDDWFAATVGGLGLTGIIIQASVRLVPVLGGRLLRKIVPLAGLGDFFRVSRALDGDWDYSVAWLDMSAPVSQLGRGYLELAKWQEGGGWLAPPPPVRLRVPFRLPVNVVNRWTVPVFNALWLRRPRPRLTEVDYSSFLWPLDGIGEWRRLYGPTPFIQCQVVVPMAEAEGAVEEILHLARRLGTPSFLNTLKVMGDKEAVGMLSFARAGVALALDLPHEGARTMELLRCIEDVVTLKGGAIYPAKDAAMSAAAFRAAYPRWQEFLKYKDANMVSDFWRRVAEDAA